MASDMASPPTPRLRPRDAIGLSKRRSSPFYGVRAVGSFLPALTRKAFEKYGFSTAALVTDWVRIVGRELAHATAPERLKWPRGVAPADLEGNAPGQSPGRGPGRGPRQSPGQGRSGATLILRVDGGLSLDVQHKARQIIERINTYFGYAAVAKLRIVQGPVGAERGSTGLATLATRPVSQPLTAEVAQIADPGLRAALARLGAEVKAGR
jgi:hypothetical protein